MKQFGNDQLMSCPLHCFKEANQDKEKYLFHILFQNIHPFQTGRGGWVVGWHLVSSCGLHTSQKDTDLCDNLGGVPNDSLPQIVCYC